MKWDPLRQLLKEITEYSLLFIGDMNPYDAPLKRKLVHRIIESHDSMITPRRYEPLQ